MRISLNNKIFLGLAVATMSLAGISFTSYANIQNLWKASIENRLIFEANDEGNRLGRLVLQLDSAARACLSNPNDASLAHYTSTKNELLVSLQTLHQIMREGSISSSGLVDELEPLVRAKVALSDEWVDKTRRGQTVPAPAIFMAGHGGLSSDSIASKLRAIRSENRRVTAARSRQSQGSWGLTMVIILLGSLVSAGVVGWAFLVIRRDIRERDILARKEEETRVLLDKVMNGCQAVIHVRDLEGRFVMLNRYGSGLYGKDARELLGKVVHLRDSFPPDIRRVVDEHGKLVLENLEGMTFEETVPVAGRERTFLTTRFPLLDQDGRPTSICTVATDITSQKEVEAAMAAAKRAAEQASQFKDQFLSTMSHELRTPLNAVIGFSELLTLQRFGSLNERQTSYANNIHTAGRHLLELINDILDLSKIEAGHLELAQENLTLDLMVQGTLESLRSIADQKSIALSCECPAGLSVRADSTRLQQILTNLVGNAIKFTQENGQVSVSATEEDSFIRVNIIDNGPGIPPEEQKRIFDSFYRARQSLDREGTGLGLAICRRLVEGHGGQFGLESEVGQGCRFFFTLPVGQAMRSVTMTQTTAGTRGLVLVVEDDDAAAQLIASQLSSEGYSVQWCEDPRQTVSLAAELRPLAITLDIVMRRVTGWQVLAQLKADPRTVAIPVILISVVEQKEIGALLGADDFLVKPVEKETLLKTLNRCLSKRRSSEPPTVLVVDDDLAVRETVSVLLEGSNYKVITAADGQEGQDLVAASLPSVVILDLLLPKVGGFELLANWRTDSRTANLPILVLTGKDLSMAEEALLRQQADGVFSKSRIWQRPLLQVLDNCSRTKSEDISRETPPIAG